MIWSEVIGPVLASEKMAELKAFLQEERKTKNIFPSGKEVFRAFDLCQYDITKVVIIGSDPYATPDTADGIAFSSKGKRPPQLEVIFKEIYRDLNIQYFHNLTLDEFFPSPDLSLWAKMGFLMLNSSLTVEEGNPGSHIGRGWELVIEAAIKALDAKKHQILYLLWGSDAQKFKDLVKNPKHLVMEAPHPQEELDNPSLKIKFTGCRHFSIVRDVIPMIHNSNIYKTVELDSCFDKEKAKKIVMEHYPVEAEKICKYIDKDLIINVPVNRDTYFSELRMIETSFSTKTIHNEL